MARRHLGWGVIRRQQNDPSPDAGEVRCPLDGFGESARFEHDLGASPRQVPDPVVRLIVRGERSQAHSVRSRHSVRARVRAEDEGPLQPRDEPREQPERPEADDADLRARADAPEFYGVPCDRHRLHQGAEVGVEHPRESS